MRRPLSLLHILRKATYERATPSEHRSVGHSSCLDRRLHLPTVQRTPASRGHLRVGNRSYAEKNGAHGATTLKAEHVDLDKTRILLDFPGKSGQRRELELVDASQAAVDD